MKRKKEMKQSFQTHFENEVLDAFQLKENLLKEIHQVQEERKVALSAYRVTSKKEKEQHHNVTQFGKLDALTRAEDSVRIQFISFSFSFTFSFSFSFPLSFLQIKYYENKVTHISQQLIDLEDDFSLNKKTQNTLIMKTQFIKQCQCLGVDCVLCLNPIHTVCTLSRLPCGHIFHQACLYNFIENTVVNDKVAITCPVCRQIHHLL